MELFEICESINNYIANNSPVLEKFQYFRRLAKNKQKGVDAFFTQSSIKDEYAFHYGGRSELQFNIGLDKECFRFGLAFSLEPSQSYPEPEMLLENSINKFNKYVKDNYEVFKNYKMWYWDKNDRSEIIKISEIPESWIQRGNFIFIGDYFNKNISEIDNNDIKIIVNHFENLFNIYRFVELTSDKIAKLCWNSSGWTKPTGEEGKSKDKNSYENINGFGHEEWLFDFEKIIDGYHYAAIQPIGKHQEKYSDCFFNILLYTYNSDTKEWFWVGWLNNVQAISAKEAELIYEQYEKNNWISEMKSDLESVNAKSSELDSFSQYTFNIKFEPHNITFFNEGLKPFSKNDKINHNRYTLLNIDQITDIPQVEKKYEIIAKSNDTQRVLTYKKTFKAESKEYHFIHGMIQDSFYQFLKEQFVNDNISKEAFLKGLNCSIDIYHERTSDSSIIYEIKSYNDVKSSLRNALGQLLEYAYFPQRNKKIKLILVTHKIADDEIKKYLDNLFNLFSLQIGYIGFDYQNGRIIDKFNCDNLF